MCLVILIFAFVGGVAAHTFFLPEPLTINVNDITRYDGIYAISNKNLS